VMASPKFLWSKITHAIPTKDKRQRWVIIYRYIPAQAYIPSSINEDDFKIIQAARNWAQAQGYESTTNHGRWLPPAIVLKMEL
jgi:hypothetical protein